MRRFFTMLVVAIDGLVWAAETVLVEICALRYIFFLREWTIGSVVIGCALIWPLAAGTIVKMFVVEWPLERAGIRTICAPGLIEERDSVGMTRTVALGELVKTLSPPLGLSTDRIWFEPDITVW